MQAVKAVLSQMSAYLQHKALHLAGLISDKEKPLGSPTISGSDQRVSINMAPRNPGEWDHCVVTMCLLIKTAVT